MNFETIAAQAAHQIDGATGAVAPPIYLSTTFERDPEFDLRSYADVEE